MSEPWERLPDETDTQYAAFTYYRELLPHERSIRNAAARSYGYTIPFRYTPDTDADQRRKVGNRVQRWERHSLANEWPARAREWDTHLDEVRRAEHVEAIREMARRHADVGRALIGAAVEALNETLRGSHRRRIGQGADRVVLAFATEGARLERAAYGLNTAADEADGRVANPQDVPREILDSDPEVAAAAAQMALQMAMARRRQEQRSNGSSA